MIRSYPWSRYDVQQRALPLRRLLILLPLALLLLYGVAHFAGVDWAHTQAVPLLDWGTTRWELYWVPEGAVSALQTHDLVNGLVSNLLLVRWR